MVPGEMTVLNEESPAEEEVFRTVKKIPKGLFTFLFRNSSEKNSIETPFKKKNLFHQIKLQKLDSIFHFDKRL